MYRYLFIAALGAIGGYLWGLSDGLAIADSVIAQVQAFGGLPLVGNN
ncbi:hypothetical protein ACVW0Y_001790 [Pseudomonas sp. TE3786]